MTEQSREPQVRFTGLDHAALAQRTRRWGWLHYSKNRHTAERPFLRTSLTIAVSNPILYLAAMGLGLGALVRQPVDGVGYLTFVAPGLLISLLVSTGAQFGTWMVFSGFKWQKQYIAAHASPLEPRQIAQGEAFAIGVRLLAQALLFWLVGLAFGAWPGVASILMVPIGALAGLAMFTTLMAYAATVYGEGLHFNIVQRLVVMPMFMFAGTFFPLASMPIYLQWIGWISPMWHGSQLARIVSFGLTEPWWLTTVHVAFLVVATVAGLWVAGHTFAKRLAD